MYRFTLVLCCFYLILITGSTAAFAQNEIRQSTRLAPYDYLLKTNDAPKDPVFDNYKIVELGANVGIGSDCGRIDFKSTLQASLKNILDTKYFGQLGNNIIASSPMLLTCYFSPTWCAILKHSQINANWLSQMRLDQCSVIDKYTDSRVDEFYKERQNCVRRSIESNGGNLEQALEECRGNVWQADLTNWAGSKNGEKASTNKLIESSAQWAGIEGEQAKSSLDLIKQFVGDVVVSRGKISVEYGPKQIPITPRTYLQNLKTVTFDNLCGKIVKKVSEKKPGVALEKVVSDQELKSLNPNGQNPIVDRQTLRSLSYMSQKQRDNACQKLAEAIGLTVFSTDVNRSLDVLNTLSQNPNLPPQRKQELEEKRRALKESVELTIKLHEQKNVPLNTVVAQINQDGAKLQSEAVEDALSLDAQNKKDNSTRASLMDCADGIMCEGP